MSAEPPAASGPDSDDPIGTRYPNAARIWNHQLGGKDNFAVDREASEAANAMVRGPGVPAVAPAAAGVAHGRGHPAPAAPGRPGAGGVMTGKVAIITGASQGIGAGLVAGYRGLGWAVVANARTIGPSEDPDMVAVEGDIADPATADRIINTALERFGRIDSLVNNAGVFIAKPFTDYTAADYATVVGVNLTGFFWLTQRVIAEMVARAGGHVVNVSATIAEVANSSTPAVLTALTKGGVAAATRSLAIEYASRGIRVNAVSPGIIQTPMHPPESYEGLGGRLPPLGHVGQISDVVDGILFLESSPNITGEILHIDGGQIAGH
jgi:NAD(P)-dependent dehydrogenase (short-subunit alcohol dehydrogenase family)